MSTQGANSVDHTEFEPIYRSRPGADAIAGASAAETEQIFPGIWVSTGLTNSYLLTTGDGRVVINTGMGFEGPVHRAHFDAVDVSPIRYIVLTQGHYDHVGGTDALRDPDTQVVAQANWAQWRDANDRLAAYRAGNAAFAWADAITAGLTHIRERTGIDLPGQSAPTPDVVVDDVLMLRVGGRHLDLIATPGGETTDSMVVWLPEERVCLCSNLFGPLFGHIPNLVTIRGDRYRDALTVIESIERVRQLRPDILITGHFGPITGAGRIDTELTRLRDAVQYLHDETVAGMNAGESVRTLMARITLPPQLAVGQGYGKASWDIRAIWENYSGWFHHQSTTELYAVGAEAVSSDVVELAGADALCDRAAQHLATGDTLHAIHLAELVEHVDPNHDGARTVLKAAHETLLAGSTNFWETAWLHKQIAAYS
jgi:glyoxylase-like metal-dependent hydrolase (beta-lactamase superfamily II)